MNKSQALAEARRRWGATAHIVDTNVTIRGLLPLRFCVGFVMSEHPQEFHVSGRGDTWDAAFADADSREKGENEHAG